MVELVKFHTVQSLGPGKNIEYMYFDIHKGKYRIETKVNGKIMEAEVDEAYQQIVNEYSQYLPEDDSNVVINAGWARDFVRKLSKK